MPYHSNYDTQLIQQLALVDHQQPPRHNPDIFEISPRPFAVAPLPNNGFQFQRNTNAFNIAPPPSSVRRPVDYLDNKRDPPLTLQQYNKNRQQLQVCFPFLYISLFHTTKAILSILFFMIMRCVCSLRP